MERVARDGTVVPRREEWMTVQAPPIRKRVEDDVQRPPRRRMTEREFVAWSRPPTRAEWIDGKVIVMSPASYDHVRLNDWPDLVIEIVSPDSESRDWREKYEEYERAGVREYWIIDPMSQYIEVYVLIRGKYRQLKEQDGKLVSRVLPGFFLKIEWLWRDPLPVELDVLRELGVK